MLIQGPTRATASPPGQPPINPPVLPPLGGPTPPDRERGKKEHEHHDAKPDASQNAWLLNGNAGTSAVTNFLGTTDEQPLEIKVNGQRALRLEPATNNAVNVIGGADVNFVAAGVSGAVIGGGGVANYDYHGLAVWFLTNAVCSDFSTIAGGGNNQILDGCEFSVIGGGAGNLISSNPVAFTSDGATIAGGLGNQIDYGSPEATIGGGYGNVIQAYAGDAATIAGGYLNVAGAGTSAIGGGVANTISPTCYETVIAGGANNTIQADGRDCSIGGGHFNSLSGSSSVICGGRANTITNATQSTIAGGMSNSVSAAISSIGGGGGNVIGDESNASSIAGGSQNTIQAGAFSCSIGGGGGNLVWGGSSSSTIGGGLKNVVAAQAPHATISGGENNFILGNDATVGGGGVNSATNSFSTVGGGLNNTAGGAYASVPGGVFNLAGGASSFAAGRRAKAVHDGAFVWADANDSDFRSGAVNQFAVRATGGAAFVSAIDASGNATAGVMLPAGSGSWSSLSDRNAKENFQPVDGSEVLTRVVSMSIGTWNYKSQSNAIRHLGPMAQDFQAAFNLGEDERHIASVDEEGVALAAIQGLNQKIVEKETRIEQLENQLRNEREKRDAESAALLRRLEALERASQAGPSQ